MGGRKIKLSGDGPTRPDIDKFGLFSEASYITSGEPYKEKDFTFLAGRAKGKQFLTTPTKKGHQTKDTFFDKEFSRIFENEAINDIVSIRRKWRDEGKKKQLVPTPFKPTNITPKPSGKGSWFGTIEQQWPVHSREIDIDSFPEKKQEKVLEHKPNIVTKPPKKGSGFGYPDVTIGPAYAHMTDPFDTRRQIEKKELADHKMRIISPKAFVAAGHKWDFFNAFAALVVDKEAAKKYAAAMKKKEQELAALAALKPPFRPTSRLGETINKYPKQEPIPENHQADESQEKQKKIPPPIFKPAGVSKSYPIRSIIEATCPIGPPTWVQEALIKTS